MDVARHCGWSIVIETCPNCYAAPTPALPVTGLHPLVVECGTIDIGAHTVKRWLNLEHEVANLFTRFNPELVIIEDNFVFRNPRSTAMLNQLRGVIMLLCAQRGIKTAIIDNNTAKKWVLGGTRYWDGTHYASVTKDHMQEAVTASLCKDCAKPQDSDSADAIALALAYYEAPVVPHQLPRKPVPVSQKAPKTRTRSRIKA